MSSNQKRVSKLLSHLSPKPTKDSQVEAKECSGRSSGKKLLMIPGPIEFDSKVLLRLGEQSVSHVDPRFIKTFGRTLINLRRVLYADVDSCESFILSGGGSLGWDLISANLCEPGDKALVLNTGYFSDNFRMCLESYGIVIDEIKYPVGAAADPNSRELKEKLKNNNYRLLAITDVDTSTSVKNPTKELSLLCNRLSPSTIVAVDGVCSFGAAEFRFSDWKIDCAMTCSQKAFGVPPGLSMTVVSSKAIDVLNNRRSRINCWYANMRRWLPIMRAYETEKVAYFSTPNVNLICALSVAIDDLLKEGMENVIARHSKVSIAFRNALMKIGLSFVPLDLSICAPTLSGIKYPSGIDGNLLRKYCKEYGVIFAGGLHKEIKTTYFRCGHMGISTKYYERDDVLKAVEAIEYALEKVGYRFRKGTAVRAYLEGLKD